MSVLQAIYDFWLDLTGVYVGTYRRNVFIVMHTAIMTSLNLFYRHESAWALLELPFSFLLWFVVFEFRKRAIADDADQRAGRYAVVNRRAMNEHPLIAVVASLIALALFVVLDLWTKHHIDWLTDIAVIGCWFFVALQQGLMVRERNKSRFSFNRLPYRIVAFGAT